MVADDADHVPNSSRYWFTSLSSAVMLLEYSIWAPAAAPPVAASDVSHAFAVVPATRTDPLHWSVVPACPVAWHTMSPSMSNTAVPVAGVRFAVAKMVLPSVPAVESSPPVKENVAVPAADWSVPRARKQSDLPMALK